MKQIYIKLQLTLAALMLCSMAATAETIEVNGIYYSLEDDDDTATLTDGSEANSGSITIPEYIEHNGTRYNVTAIGSYAFED